MSTEVPPADSQALVPQPAGVVGLHQRRFTGPMCHAGGMPYTDISLIDICSVKLFTNHPQNRPRENGHFVEDSGSARIVSKTVEL